MIANAPIGLPPAAGSLYAYLPSEPLDDARWDRLAMNARRMKADFDLHLRLPSRRNRPLLFSPKWRAREIELLLADPNCDGVIAAWGGKTALELLPYLDFDAIANAEKPILGFSDGGVVANAVTATTGLITFYGPNVAGKLDEVEGLSWDCIRGPAKHEITLLEGDSNGQSPLNVVGRSVVADLSTFVLGLVGTQWMPLGSESDPIILVVESTENLQIQRQLFSSLQNQGLLAGVAAIVLGRGPRFDERWSIGVREVLTLERPSGFPPLVLVENFGHGPGPNPIIPIGIRARLVVDATTVELISMEPPVR